MDLKSSGEGYYHNLALKHRRHLHSLPELSLQEKKTSQYCLNYLASLGYKILPIWKYGFIADLQIGKSQTVAFRADMDALPIQEATSLPFKSVCPGISHACGHDAHMAIMLTLAKVIIDHQNILEENIRFIFQPSEEEFPGGAKFMIANGALKNIDEIYALHNDPLVKTGIIRINDNIMTANCDLFSIRIYGSSGHASKPEMALDPIYISTQIIQQILLIRSKSISSFNPAVINITSITSDGKTPGIIPDSCEFSGIIRSFGQEDRINIRNHINKILQPIKMLGYKFQFDSQESYPSIINHKIQYQKLCQSSKGHAVISQNINPELWGEDFSYYLQKVPGAFCILGSGNEKISSPLHSSDFNIDEGCMIIAIKILSSLLKIKNYLT